MPVRVTRIDGKDVGLLWPAAVCALAVAIAGSMLMTAEGRAIEDTLLYALIAAAAVLGIALSIRALAARRDLQARARNASQDHFNRTVWSRLLQGQRVTDILLCERKLQSIETRLVSAARAMQTYGDPQGDLALWREAAGEWVGAVGPVVPEIARDIVAPGQTDLRRARAALPPSRNLSSADLKAATAFLIESAQLDAARQRFDAQRDAVIADFGTRSVDAEVTPQRSAS